MSTTEVVKQDWLDEYAHRILTLWHKWQGPFGLDEHYIEQLKLQLEDFYDDSLKRDLIESTYQPLSPEKPDIQQYTPQYN